MFHWFPKYHDVLSFRLVVVWRLTALFFLISSGVSAQEGEGPIVNRMDSIARQKDSIALEQQLPHPKKDSIIVLDESDLESVASYSARDSIYNDFKTKRVYLYGDAHLNYEGIDMRAEYLVIDMDSNQVFATYVLDSAGKRIGAPIFVDGGDTIRAASLKYNFDTKKAYIKEVGIKQEEIYLSMEIAKRQSNEEIHFVRGKFTTCNLPEPHYHFLLSKAVLVPDKRIVTGPMNLWIMGAPTPLGLPFSVIPQKKKDEREKKSGFMMPQMIPTSNYGFGIQDLGYYVPINEKVQTTLYGMLYSRGSFGLKTSTEYNVKYKFKGKLDIGYNSFRQGFPYTGHLSTTTFVWNHAQDPKLNPNWSFNSAVNFNSSGSNQKTLNLQSPQYFNNTLNSDIRLGRTFGALPISATVKASMRQNSVTKRIDLTLPEFNFTANRFFPFKRKHSSDGKVHSYETIGMNYSLDGVNRSSFKNSYLAGGHFDSIAPTFQNGLRQSVSIQNTYSFFQNLVQFTPMLTYSQKYNFQSVQESYNPTTGTITVDSLNRGAFSHNFSWSNSFTTNIYSYYRFIGKRSTLLRHVARPSISFVYAPAIQQGIKSYTDASGRVIQYSTLQNSVYSESYAKNSGKINFSLSNTFDLKQKSEKDTVTGFKKIHIIESLLLSTGYDLFKDSMNWDNLSIGIAMHPIDPVNINIRGDYSWYAWDKQTGAASSKYAINNGQGLGRLNSYSIATSWTITTKKSREILDKQQTIMSNNWNPQYQQWLIMPSQMIFFDIPWKISLSHVLSYTLNRDPLKYSQQRYLPTNTLTLSGDVAITENWKLAGTTFLDIGTGKVVNTNITMLRNIHCWNVNFTWTPIGTNKSFLVGIRGSAQALSQVKLNLRKPPLIF